MAKNYISQAPDLSNLDEWFRSEVALLKSPAVEAALLLIISDLDSWVKFPTDSILLWPGCNRDQKQHQYPKNLTHKLKKEGIAPYNRANGPALSSYLFAGGERPSRTDDSGWSVHHLYSGKFPHPNKSETLHAVKNGSHFTMSAGLVAIHPVADAMADEFPCFSWYLRAKAFQLFDYDPDHVFEIARMEFKRSA
ncbi:MAG: hypothetical protein V4598_16580 [Bdellovibrionota bacterium]